jgi:unsaturated chondroitin disaccharide hydrolase
MTDSLRTQVIHGLRYARVQARRLVERHPGASAAYTERGKWRLDVAEAVVGEPTVARMARLFLESGAGEDAEFWREVAAGSTWDGEAIGRAGQAVARRFRPNGQYLQSAAGEAVLSIESMADVGVLWVAARAGSDAMDGLNAHELKRRAVQHCLTVQRVLCRGDGSVAEEGVFEAETGAFLRQSARRGFRADSCWARGLAFSLYGFGVAHELTGDRRFLKTAEDQAEFWMMNTPEAGVPPWDFDAPMDGQLTLMQGDSSAAAVAAVGLFRLGRATHDRVRARAYEDAAMRTVETLTRAPYLASGDATWEGILKGGVYDNRQGVGVDESVMIGDVFVVEAMVRALELL